MNLITNIRQAGNSIVLNWDGDQLYYEEGNPWGFTYSYEDATVFQNISDTFKIIETLTESRPDLNGWLLSIPYSDVKKSVDTYI